MAIVEYVQNGTFDDDFLYWTKGSLNVQIMACQSMEGTLCKSAYATQVGGINRWIYQPITPIVCRNVTDAYFWVYHAWGGAPSQSIQFTFRFSDGTSSSWTKGPFPTHVWTKVSMYAEIHYEGYKVLVGLQINWVHTDMCSVNVDGVHIFGYDEGGPPIDPDHQILIGDPYALWTLENDCILSCRYIKSHPNPDPDTFELRLLPECGERINFFDRFVIKKLSRIGSGWITEYYGFVEEITPEVGEDGLEYLITGRCWKLMSWKKFNERYQESREVGPEDSEGNIESGFFGDVKPEELVKFIMRCPVSEHPKGKIRHKIGWGIASDRWSCCANITAACHYPEWVALRYTGLAWRNRGDTDIVDEYVLDVKTFVSVDQDWSTVGANPWLDAEDSNYIKADATASGRISEYYTFENFADIGFADPISLSSVYLCCVVWGEIVDISAVYLYLWDGISWVYAGEAASDPFYTKRTTCLNVTAILDTVTKIKNARLKVVQKNKVWTAVDHAYLKVYGASPLNPADQRVDDYFIVNMNNSYDDVTAMLIECRNNPIMYARHYKIEFTNLSNCCNDDDPVPEADWHDFTPSVNVINNEARDILHSWEPEDDVRCIRIKLTMSDCNAWEISQIYIWKADTHKYRLMDEGD